MQLGETKILSESSSNSGNLLLDYEWLETNCLGGYSSSTILNCHTRKYHGLLVADLKQNSNRFVTLSKFDEQIEYEGQNFYLTYHYYEPGVYVPFDDKDILAFDFAQNPCPSWKFKHENFEIHKSLQMIHGENTVLIKYSFFSSSEKVIKIKLRPLFAQRNFHQVACENNSANLKPQLIDQGIKVRLYEGLPEVFITLDQAYSFINDDCWYKNFRYVQEVARGYPAREDLACPGLFEINVKPGDTFFLRVSLENQSKAAAQSWQAESERRNNLSKHKKPDLLSTVKNLIKSDCIDTMARQLDLAADQFVIKTADNNYSIIAGYHWFGEWGRDTMISLPGLLLGRDPEFKSRKILKRFLNHKKNGLVPNIISDNPSYNSVDASLWLFWTVQELAASMQDYSWIKRDFWEDLLDIFEHFSYSKTTKVKCLDNGLIESGSEEDSLSWMDACLDGHSVIPRRGCLVEINALWYNTVCFTAELGRLFGHSTIVEQANCIKLKIQESFTRTFYIREKAYLGDYFCNGMLNTQIRPNQVFAASLPYSPISKEQAVNVIRTIDKYLLTPFGLRTLSPEDPAYQGIYSGDVKQRDQAYHNGTVWPWLLGAYGDVLFKITDKAKAKKKIREIIKNFHGHINQFGMNSISEIFDGEFPHTARGCVAQAWSVAELRRLFLRTCL
jgi:predicted glycogen debranching enzyme